MAFINFLGRPSLRIETLRVFPMIRMAMHEKRGNENILALRNDKLTRVPILKRHTVQQIQRGI